ncbi:MAG: MBG domain-containing protein [Dehalococcoidales bacterium]|nr:MBG domain-containing protein [Dehalococcoidales bacterium]
MEKIKVEKTGLHRKKLVRLAFPFILLLTLLALIAPMAVPVSAADTTINPDSDASIDLSRSSGSPYNNYSRVSDSSDNTYVYTNDSDWERDRYNFSNPASPTGTINSIRIYMRVQRENVSSNLQPSARTYLRFNSRDYYGDEETVTTSWADYYTQYNTTPGSNPRAWTWNDIEDIAAGVSLRDARSGYLSANTRCSKVWVVIDYTLPGITVTPTSGLTTTEDGGTDTFTIVLDSKPSSDVTIGLSSSDTTEGTVSPSSVTFKADSIASVSQVRRPTADGNTRGAWTPDSNRYARIDEDPYDDADYMTGTSTSSGSARQLFTFSNFNVPADATNIRLTVHFRARDDSTGSGNIAAAIRVDGNNWYGDLENTGNSFAQYSHTWSSNPEGGAWTVDEINGVSGDEFQQFGVYSTDLSPDVRVSAVWAEVACDIPVPGNWDIPQTVTVTGVDDDLYDDDIAYTVITAPAVSGDPAYNGVDAGDVSVTNINNDTIISTTLNVSPASGAYGGTVDLTASLSPAVSGKTINFTLNGASVGTVDTDAGGVAAVTGVSLSGIDAGTYVGGVAAGFAGDSGYSSSSGSNDLTVSPKPLTVTSDAQSKVYGEDDPDLTYTSSLEGIAFSGALARDPGEDVGSYAITQGDLSAGDNYSITFVGASITITQASSAITIVAEDAVYDGSPHGGTAAVAGAGGLNESLTVSYTGRDGTAYGPTGAAPVNVGDYTASAEFAGDANHSGCSAGRDFSITAAGLTITASDASKTYGETITFTGTEFSVTGLASGESIAGVTLASDGAAASAQVGTYDIIAEDAVAGPNTDLANYSITYKKGFFLVLPKVLTITAHDAVKTCGEELIFNGTEFFVAGLVGTDSVTSVELYSEGAAAAAAPGTYPIKPSNAQGTGLTNYAMNYVGGTLTVNAYKLVIITPEQTFTQGGVSGRITVQVRDSDEEAIIMTVPLTVSLTSTGSTGQFALNASGLPLVDSVTILPGTTSAGFYYTDAEAGAPVITVSAEGYTGDSQTVTVLARAEGPAGVVIVNETIPPFTEGGVSERITVQVQDSQGIPVKVTVPLAVSLTSTPGSTGRFALNASGLPLVDSVTILPGAGSATFYYTSSAAGDYTITAGADGLESDSKDVTVNAIPAPADRIAVITGDAITVKKGTVSGRIAIQLQRDGAPIKVTAPALVALSAGAGSFGKNGNGLPVIGSVTVLPGTSSAVFYYRAPNAAGEQTITVSGDGFEAAVITVVVIE